MRRVIYIAYLIAGAPVVAAESNAVSTVERDRHAIAVEMAYTVHRLTLELGKMGPHDEKPTGAHYDKDPASGTFKSEKMSATSAIAYFFPYATNNTQLLAGVGFEMMNGQLSRSRGSSGRFYLWSVNSEFGVKSRVTSWSSAEIVLGFGVPAGGKAYLEYESEHSTSSGDLSVVETQVRSGNRASIAGRLFYVAGSGIQCGLGSSMYLGRLRFEDRGTSHYVGTGFQAVFALAL